MLKKNVCLSLALMCGVSLVSASLANAKVESSQGVPVPPTLKLSGYSVFSSMFTKQANERNGRDGSPHFQVPVSDLTLNVMGIAGNGIKYGYTANLQTYPNSKPIVDQNYIHFSGSFGTFHLGNVSGANDRMVYDGMRIIGGTGGPDGGYADTFNLAAGAIKGNSMIGESDEATKVSWYSPQVWGFQLGVSYTPNTGHSGDGKRETRSVVEDGAGNSSSIYPNKKVSPYGLHNIAVGLTFNQNVGDLRVTLSAVALTERSYYSFQIPAGTEKTVRRIHLRNAKSYQLGAIFGWHDFQIGGGYLNNGHSRMPRTNNAPLKGSLSVLDNSDLIFQERFPAGNAGSAYNIAASYKMGIHQVAGAFQRTVRKTDAVMKARNEVYSVTYDVNVLTGMKWFVEGDYIRSKSNEPARRMYQSVHDSVGEGKVALRNNDGMMAITGVKIAF